MPNRDPGLDAAREAHLAAYFAAGDFAAALDLDSRNPYRLDWLRFRVAQQYFFSQHAHGECRQQFRDNVRHRQMQRAEFAAICDLEPAGLLNLVRGQAHPGTAIYCSFHLGAWAIQPVLLQRRGVPLAIVAGPGMAVEHGRTMMAINAQARARNLVQVDLSVVASDGAGAALQMFRALRSGRSLYICIDGQRGASGALDAQDDDRHSVPIRFSGRDIQVRMGAAYLSHKLGLPLVPMVSWRESDGTVSAEIGEAIHPGSESREAFASRALQQLWSGFEQQAQRHGWQWEMGWYSYRTRQEPGHPARPASTDSRYHFNDARYHVYEATEGLLLDERNDALHTVPPAYARWLAKLQQLREGIPGSTLRSLFKDPQSLQQLLQLELLVAR
jgi:lauroyl/myristoyl acyltransferase